MSLAERLLRFWAKYLFFGQSLSADVPVTQKGFIYQISTRPGQDEWFTRAKQGEREILVKRYDQKEGQICLK